MILGGVILLWIRYVYDVVARGWTLFTQLATQHSPGTSLEPIL